MRDVVVYLSGPITGLPLGNRTEFIRAAEMLTEQGYSVLNPHNNFGGRLDLARHRYMKADIGLLLGAELLIALPGWRGSKGCRTEVQVAFEIGLTVEELDPDKKRRTSILPFDLTDPQPYDIPVYFGATTEYSPMIWIKRLRYYE
jgi:hypothetical protein